MLEAAPKILKTFTGCRSRGMDRNAAVGEHNVELDAGLPVEFLPELSGNDKLSLAGEPNRRRCCSGHG